MLSIQPRPPMILKSSPLFVGVFGLDAEKRSYSYIYGTWYGRVMVERIEGFCQEEEWKRAYQEINQMERHIANSGAVILENFGCILTKKTECCSWNAKIPLPAMENYR